MKKLLGTALTLVFCGVIFAQEKGFEKVLLNFHQEQSFNGAVLVAKGDSILFSKAIGISDRDNQDKHQVSDRFKIASMTKVFTSVLIMKLVEEKKISLTDNIGKYFPSYKGEGKNSVMINDLLTYSSGIEGQMNDMGNIPFEKEMNLDDFISKYCSGPLAFEPGTKSEYGNEEYIILTKIIERVSDKTYDDFLKEIITKPLEMENTGICDNDITGDSFKGYVYNDSLNTFQQEDAYFIENYFGAGAMYSTLQDIFLFDNALFNERLLNSETTSKLLEINGSLGNTAYGLWGSDGWGKLNEKFYYRTGAIMGNTSNWIRTMENNVSIIVFSNTNTTNLYQLSEQLFSEAMKK